MLKCAPPCSGVLVRCAQLAVQIGIVVVSIWQTLFFCPANIDHSCFAVPQANLIRRLEEHEKEACAIVKDDKHLQSSKLQAIAVLAKTAKAIITDMHKENLRLHAALRRAEFERQQADNAVRGAADTLMSYQNQIASAKMAERVDILEHLEKCRKDNARLQVGFSVPRQISSLIAVFPFLKPACLLTQRVMLVLFSLCSSCSVF